MRRRTFGFTMIELVVVIFIGGLLMTITLPSLQNARARFAPRGAKDMYATLHQRARARAVEMGQTVLFIVDSSGDSALMVSNGVVSDVTHFREELNVDLRSSPDSFLICMTPRGYADVDCPVASFTATTNSPIRLEFWLNGDSTSVIILPMGQLVGM